MLCTQWHFALQQDTLKRPEAEKERRARCPDTPPMCWDPFLAGS